MRTLFQQILSFFPLGVRWLLAILLTVYLAALVGKSVDVIDLYSWLALSSPAFWNGSVWQIITYIFLPASLLDFVTNSIVLAVLAARLETVWTARQLWSFCCIAALGAGLGKVLLTPHSLTPLMGMGGVILGLLIACARLRGSVAALLTGLRSMSVGQLVFIFAALGFLLNVIQRPGDLLDYLPLLCGGIAGWLYPWPRWKGNRIEQNLPVTSARIGKLEL